MLFIINKKSQKLNSVHFLYFQELCTVSALLIPSKHSKTLTTEFLLL